MGQCEDGSPVFGSYPAGGFALHYGDHFVSGILTDWGEVAPGGRGQKARP